LLLHLRIFNELLIKIKTRRRDFEISMRFSRLLRSIKYCKYLKVFVSSYLISKLRYAYRRSVACLRSTCLDCNESSASSVTANGNILYTVVSRFLKMLVSILKPFNSLKEAV
jgi:hypothetical protein